MDSTGPILVQCPNFHKANAASLQTQLANSYGGIAAVLNYRVRVTLLTLDHCWTVKVSQYMYLASYPGLFILVGEWKKGLV